MLTYNKFYPVMTNNVIWHCGTFRHTVPIPLADISCRMGVIWLCLFLTFVQPPLDPSFNYRNLLTSRFALPWKRNLGYTFQGRLLKMHNCYVVGKESSAWLTVAKYTRIMVTYKNIYEVISFSFSATNMLREA